MKTEDLMTEEVIKEFELTTLDRKLHPEYFYKGSQLNLLIDVSGIYTAKDFSDIEISDNTLSSKATILALEFIKCDSSTG